ncbi:hypothetical protein SZ64_12950 [Erythrobacter sp. SG61-1L]|nr:hypothetical protein SZ64_12950 [Erythrobacter sp. SG61-1L]
MPVSEVAQRINRGSISMLTVFVSGVTGGVVLNRLSLGYRSSIFDYNAKPRLSGRLRSSPGGTELNVRFGTPVWVFVVFAFFYLLLTFVTVIVAFPAIHGDPRVDREALPYFLLVMLAFYVSPLIMHFILTRGAEADLERMLEFLEQEVQAVPQERIAS